MENVLERALHEINRLKKSKFIIPTNPRRLRTIGKGESYYRVAIPDTHGMFVDLPALKACLDDLEILRPLEVILLGDHLECGGFLAEHQTLAYVAESNYSFVDDKNAAMVFLDSAQARCPSAIFEYLEGNHERRIERWIMTQEMRNNKDPEWMKGLHSAKVVLELEKRGIAYYEQCQMYDGLTVPGTIKRGKCYFTHGSYTGDNAAKKHLERFSSNVCFGHIHSAQIATNRTVAQACIAAWSPGCLCIQQRLWNHTNPTTWTHGYGLQIVQPTGDFLHINVPIINGTSYLAPLLNMLKL